MKPYDWARERWWVRWVPLLVASFVAGCVAGAIR